VWIRPCRDKLLIPMVIVVPRLVPLSKTCPLHCVAQSPRGGWLFLVSERGGGLPRRSLVSRVSQTEERAHYGRASALEQACEHAVNEVFDDEHRTALSSPIPPLCASLQAGDGKYSLVEVAEARGRLLTPSCSCQGRREFVRGGRHMCR
jgi:hypothetical protein